MAVDLRLPSISPGSSREQINQLWSYLYQLVSQLNWALEEKETGGELPAGQTEESLNPRLLYAAIKDLVADSGEIAEGHLEKLRPRLDLMYLSFEDFSLYKEETEGRIEGLVKTEKLSREDGTWLYIDHGNVRELSARLNKASYSAGQELSISFPRGLSVPAAFCGCVGDMAPPRVSALDGAGITLLFPEGGEAELTIFARGESTDDTGA